MKIDSYDELTFSRGVFTKANVLYGRKGSTVEPLAYISKPKWVEQSAFDDLMNRLVLTIKPEQPNQGDKTQS